MVSMRFWACISTVSRVLADSSCSSWAACHQAPTPETMTRTATTTAATHSPRPRPMALRALPILRATQLPPMRSDRDLARETAGPADFCPIRALGPRTFTPGRGLVHPALVLKRFDFPLTAPVLV